MRVKEATHGAGLDLKEASGLQVKGHNAVFPRQQVANVAGWSGRTSMQDLHDASSRPELSHGKLFSKYHYLAFRAWDGAILAEVPCLGGI